MANNTTAEAIVSLYESSGLTTLEISQALALDETIVSAVLRSRSESFRAAQSDAPDISGADFEAARGVILEIMKDADQAGFVRLQAARFVFDEKKGRNDAKLGGILGAVNITVVNERLESVKERKAAALRPIEIAPAE